MSSPTTHFNLAKPAVNSPTDQDQWGGELNNDLDIIDAQLYTAQRWMPSAKTVDYSVTTSDLHTLFTGDSTAANMVFTLPTLASVGTGFPVAFKKIDAGTNAVTVKGNGTELIDVANSYVLSDQNDVIVVVSDTSAWRVLSVSSPSTGNDTRVLQTQNFQTGTAASGSGVIPYDDTIPQNTEGNLFLSLTITPKSSTSILVIEAILNLSNDAIANMAVCLFRDTNVNAIAVSEAYQFQAQGGLSIPLRYVMTSGTTSATTFYIRAGGNTGNTTLNGNSGSRAYGGVYSSGIRITEYLA